METGKTQKQLLYGEISKYSLDLSKLVFGGIILAGIMDLKPNTVLLLALGSVFVAVLAAIGVVFFNLSNRKSK